MKATLRSYRAGIVLCGLILLSCASMVAEDSESSCCDTGMIIEIPASVDGSIDKAHEKDAYLISVSEESHIAFDIDAWTYGSPLRARLELCDEHGAYLGHKDRADGEDPYIECDLPPGQYCVIVSGYGDSTGWYELSIDRALDVGGVETMDVDIPDDLNGWIDAKGEEDVYEFYVYGNSWIIIDVDAEETGSRLNPVLELYDRKGIWVGSDDDTDGLDPYLRYCCDGMYYVVVRGSEHESTGWYALSIERDYAPLPGEMTVEMPVEVSGWLGTSSEEAVYWFHVDGDMNVRVDIDATPHGSSLDAWLHLRDKYGELVALSYDADGPDPRIVSTLSPGFYYVVVGSSKSFGWYDLYVTASQSGPSESVLGPSGSEKTVGIPADVYGRIGRMFEEDIYRFYVDHYRYVVIDLDTHGSYLTSNIELFAESGELMCSDNDGAGPYRQAGCWVSPGAYYVVIRGHGVSIGWYELRIQ